jgi:hypothetical protein
VLRLAPRPSRREVNRLDGGQLDGGRLDRGRLDGGRGAAGTAPSDRLSAGSSRGKLVVYLADLALDSIIIGLDGTIASQPEFSQMVYFSCLYVCLFSDGLCNKCFKHEHVEMHRDPLQHIKVIPPNFGKVRSPNFANLANTRNYTHLVKIQ